MSFAVTNWTSGSSDCRLFLASAPPRFPQLLQSTYASSDVDSVTWWFLGSERLSISSMATWQKCPWSSRYSVPWPKTCWLTCWFLTVFVFIAEKFARMTKLCKFPFGILCGNTNIWRDWYTSYKKQRHCTSCENAPLTRVIPNGVKL